MNFRPCTSCNKPLTARGMLDGKCHSCGAAIPGSRTSNDATSVPTPLPAFIPPASPGHDNPSAELTQKAAPFGAPLPLRIQWIYVFFTILFVAMAGVMLYSAVSEKRSEVRSTSRRVRAMQQFLGDRGTDVVCCLVFVGVAGLMGTQILTRKPKEKKLPVIPPPEKPGWWLVPLALESRDKAWAAGTIGLFAGIPLATLFCGGILAAPYTKKPLDMGGILCLGPFAAVVLAFVVNCFASRRGFRLSILGWLLLPLVFVGIAWANNEFAAVRELSNMKSRLMASDEGKPEFESDAELKQAFVKILDEVAKDKSPELVVRIEQKHDKEHASSAKTELAIWKLDPSFGEFARLKMDIPGSKLAFTEVYGSLLMTKIADGLKTIVPERRLKLAGKAKDASTDNKPVLEIEATSKHDGGFSKFSSSFGRPSLLAHIRIDWKVRLVSKDGTQLYAKEWSSRPEKQMAFNDMPLGHEYAPYKLMQLSAHDNFAREFLGKLGLPPGEVKKSWSFKEW